MSFQLQSMLQQAIQSFQSGNLERADSILKKVLQLDSKNLHALHILGLIKASQGHFSEAVVLLGKAARINPSDASIQYNLAKALSDSGNDKDAIAHHKKAANLAPNNPEAWLNFGKAASNLGHYEDALICFGNALDLKPDYVEALVNKGATLKELKRYDEAIKLAEQALALNPNLAEAWSNKGVALKELGRYDEAIVQYDTALNLMPYSHELLTNKGVVLHELKRYEEAITHYDKALSISPNYRLAWSNKGAALDKLELYDELITHCAIALASNQNDHEAITNKGSALQKLKRIDEAIADYDKALSLNTNFHLAWGNKGYALHELKRYNEAIANYDKAISLKPDYYQAIANKGATLHELKRYNEAITHYDKAISLKPEFHEAWADKGVALYELKRLDEALACYDKAISLMPECHKALTNKGYTLTVLKRLDEAITNYEKALEIKPDIDWVRGSIISLKMKICDWAKIAEEFESISNGLRMFKKVVGPFILLSLSDDIALQQTCSRIFARNTFPLNSSLGPILRRPQKEKIRIAYFSPDFGNHPVGLLTSELFEIHNRDKFEVFGFSLRNAPAGDLINARLKKGFDEFIDVESLQDSEVAKLARQLHIDIAIDLAGPTAHSRTGIFSYRAAPIQVNWLGYAGTIGAEYIDYILADKTVIPEPYQQFYDEKVVYLPDSYMVDDTKRIASPRKFTKKECGLPENAFVFCCFNADYKFNAHVLDIWSRILLQVGDSVLWISENNASFKDNIKLQFEVRGIDTTRIIFAPRLDLMEDHLARFLLADLFLDTFPYNAHTTAIDSLKTGVPVLTMAGQSFASRVAASLLNAIELPDLITTTPGEYEMLAIELANNHQKFSSIKNRLKDNRFTTPLFDTPRFAKNIEDAYIKMYERYQSNLEPDHIA